jgi:hypothetical protein
MLAYRLLPWSLVVRMYSSLWCSVHESQILAREWFRYMYHAFVRPYRTKLPTTIPVSTLLPLW